MELTFTTLDKYVDPKYKMAVEMLMRFGWLRYINEINEKDWQLLYKSWEESVYNSGYEKETISDIIKTTREEFPMTPESFPNIPETTLNSVSTRTKIYTNLI